MKKIVCSLIISVCLGVNLYASNMKDMWLYIDTYEDSKASTTTILSCRVGIKPSQNSPSGYKTFEVAGGGVFYRNKKDLQATLEDRLRSCTSLREDLIDTNNNIKFKERDYNPKVLEILYNHYK